MCANFYKVSSVSILWEICLEQYILYRRMTPKLFNITARKLKVEVKVGKKRAPGRLKKEERKPPRAKCPHLGPNKTCARMIREGLDGNLSDFDIKHFCKGNLILCYYFRMPQKRK